MINHFAAPVVTFDKASVAMRVRAAQAAWRRADAAYMEAGPDASAEMAKKVDDAMANLDEARDLLLKIS